MSDKRRSRFGVILKSYREQQGLSQDSLAEDAGYGWSSSIRGLENASGSSRRPTLPTIVEIAHALRLTKKELIILVLASLEDRIEESGYSFEEGGENGNSEA